MAALVATPAWAAVVVNYHSGPMLGECVDALLGDVSAGRPEVVVVDNGSATGEVGDLSERGPGVTVLRPGANLGYARAANLGIAATSAPIVAVINPDAILESGSAARVVAVFRSDDRVAVVGPTITNPDGTVYPSARTAPGPAVAVGHAVLGGIAPKNRFTRSYRQLDSDSTVAREVDWVSGAALWFRRSTLDQIGGWDERFFLFMEDVDVCRVVRAAGGVVRYEPNARVMHVVGTSRAAAPVRSIVLHHRAAYRYADKWWHGPQRLALPAAAAFLAARAGVLTSVSMLHRPVSPARPKSHGATG